MELCLVYCNKDAACRCKKFSCQAQAAGHKAKPFITGKIIFVGKAVAGVVWGVYINEVDFVLVFRQQFLESGIVVGGDENVACCG